jgi:transposase
VRGAEWRRDGQRTGQSVQLASHVDPSMETRLREGTPGVFERGSQQVPEVDEEKVKDHHAKIGVPAVGNDFLARKLKPWTGK